MARSTGSREPARQAARRRRQRRERRRRLLSVLAGVIALVTLIAGAVLLVQEGEAPGPADAGSAAGWDAPAFTGGPRLAVDRTIIDHGSVPYGYEVEASYRLKNVGDQLLRIDNPEVTILDGCWPPQPVVGQTTLQPGEETTLDIAFSMHEGMGGPHTFEVLLPSNDAVEATTSLTVAATYPEP